MEHVDEFLISLISFLAGVGARDLFTFFKKRLEAKTHRGDKPEQSE